MANLLDTIQRGAIAAGNMRADGTVDMRAGQVTPLRTGAGVYTLTSALPIFVISEIIVKLTLLVASGIIRYAFTSTTVLTVSTFAVDGTTATDKGFSYEIEVVPPGQ